MLVFCQEWHHKRIVARAFSTPENALRFAMTCGSRLIKVYPCEQSNRLIVDYWFIPAGANEAATETVSA